MKTLTILDLPLSGSHLIEASAGTGKTYTIAALYVRLILEYTVDNARALSPENILVVTFTEAATKELRDRIRARLSEAAQYFRTPAAVTEDVFLRDLRNKYAPSAWPNCAKRIDVAANFMDESAIYTIHGWCKKMLQQHAFDSLSPFMQEVLTNEVELLNKVVTDYWRIHFYLLNKMQCRLILSKIAISPHHLLKAIRYALFKTEALTFEQPLPTLSAIFAPIEAWEIERQQHENQAKQHWLKHKETIDTLLMGACAEKWLNQRSYAQNTFQQKLAAIHNWANGLNEGLKHDDLGKFGLTKLTKGLVAAHHDKASKFNVEAFRYIDDYVTHLEGKADKEKPFKTSLYKHAIQWVRERYEQEKQAVACMTFDDMISRLDFALNKGENAQRLASVIAQQYPIALIDEFQDTDPVQYRIFSKIYPSQQHNHALAWFMIGDPKQAIYSFRGADINTYLMAREATIGNHHTLGTNFRSTISLIDAINRMFVHGDKQPLGAFRFKKSHQQKATNPLPFLPVDAKGREENWVVNGKAAAALTCWHWGGDKSIASGQYQANMAQVTASEIVALLNSEGTGFKKENGEFQRIKPSDIAILVRTGREAQVMRLALRERNLRSIYLSERDSVYQSPQAQDVLIWLEAFASPCDERKVRAALSTQTFGFSYEALHEFVLDEIAWESHVNRFMAYKTRWQKDGILATLHALLHDYQLHNVQDIDHYSERQLTNILHLAENLQQDSAKLEGQQALISHLAELIFNAHNQGSDDTVVRLESDAELIKVITIHKSKGLEYPLVFLPFACGFREDTEDENCLLRANDEERLREDLRLFYVAVTRARYACWLGVAPIRKGRGDVPQLELTALGHLLGWQAGTPASALFAHLHAMKGDCCEIAVIDLPHATNECYVDKTTHDKVLASALTSTTYIPDNWWVASYSALTFSQGKTTSLPREEIEVAQDDAQRDDVEALEFPRAQDASIHSLPKGASPGVLVHGLLEQCAHHGFHNVANNPALQQQLIAQRFTGKIWSDERQSILKNALQDWLNTDLLSGQGACLREIVAYKSEVEFLIGADNVDVQTLDALLNQHLFVHQTRPALHKNQLHGLLKGFIDLVFVHNEKYYVVDYKFSYLGESDAQYSPAALVQTLLNHRYDLQYSLYLLALHRLLRLRLGTAYEYDKHVGGAVYWFLRGNRCLFDKPSREAIEQLDALFSTRNIGNV